MDGSWVKGTFFFNYMMVLYDSAMALSHSMNTIVVGVARLTRLTSLVSRCDPIILPMLINTISSILLVDKGRPALSTEFVYFHMWALMTNSAPRIVRPYKQLAYKRRGYMEVGRCGGTRIGS